MDTAVVAVVTGGDTGGDRDRMWRASVLIDLSMIMLVFLLSLSRRRAFVHRRALREASPQK